MVTYRELVSALSRLGLAHEASALVHASLSAFGEVVGGAETVVGALVGSLRTVIVPAFTPSTMITPPLGPPGNAMVYGASHEHNAKAEFFHLDLPSDRSKGVVAETLRLHPDAARSHHPIYSFAGIHAEAYLEQQTLDEPLAPMRALADADGVVLLLGVDQRANLGIHLGRQLGGQSGFTRWALTIHGVAECPACPGCSDGFNRISGRLGGIVRQTKVGPATLRAMPLRDLLHLVIGWTREDPLALLCDRPSCVHCSAERELSQIRPAPSRDSGRKGV